MHRTTDFVMSPVQASPDTPVLYVKLSDGYLSLAKLEDIQALLVAERKTIRKLFDALHMQFGASAGSATGVTIRNDFGEEWGFQIDRSALSAFLQHLASTAQPAESEGHAGE